MKRNIQLLYGFSFFDQFMMVIPLFVPYLATKGIAMAQFMELQAVFALVIMCGQLPTGLLSDLWGRKKTLLLGSALKAVSFTLLPLWNSFEGFLVYHLTMGIALSTISGGDVALLYESSLAARGEKARGIVVLGNAKFAGQAGVATSALMGGAVVTLSYEHLLWANAILSWIPVLLVLCLAEPQVSEDGAKKRPQAFTTVISTILGRDMLTRLIFLNMVASGVAGLVMVWTNQKYWQESGVPLAYFGVLYAGYHLLLGLAGRSAAHLAAQFGSRPVLVAVGVLPVAGYFAMAAFVGWGGVLLSTLIPAIRGLGDVLFVAMLNERISSAFRATVNSLANLMTRASFAVLGPVVGYGIDGRGLPFVMASLGILFSVAFVCLLVPLISRNSAAP